MNNGSKQLSDLSTVLLLFYYRGLGRHTGNYQFLGKKNSRIYSPFETSKNVYFSHNFIRFMTNKDFIKSNGNSQSSLKRTFITNNDS